MAIAIIETNLAYGNIYATLRDEKNDMTYYTQLVQDKTSNYLKLCFMNLATFSLIDHVEVPDDLVGNFSEINNLLPELKPNAFL